MDKGGRINTFGKIFLILLSILGLAVLWLGTCFGIGLVGFGLAFNNSGSEAFLGAILFYSAFIIPTILVVWLFIKILKWVNKK